MNDDKQNEAVAEDPALTAALGAGEPDAEQMPETAADGAENPAPADDVPTGADAAAEAAALFAAFPYLPEASRSVMQQAPRYTALRALGLSAKEAALAAFGELPAAGVAGQGKAHLTTLAGKAGVEPLPTMSEEQYATAREVFGESVSDAELEALYRRVR